MGAKADGSKVEERGAETEEATADGEGELDLGLVDAAVQGKSSMKSALQSRSRAICSSKGLTSHFKVGIMEFMRFNSVTVERAEKACERKKESVGRSGGDMCSSCNRVEEDGAKSFLLPSVKRL